MTEYKFSLVFKKGTERRRYTKNFYALTFEGVLTQINVFVDIQKAKGWHLLENKILSARAV
jgi:hypothetical protein